MKTYSAHDYLAAFEPWILEDRSALPGILAQDTLRANLAAHRLVLPITTDGKYPVEVWLLVHPLVGKGEARAACRRDRTKPILDQSAIQSVGR